MSTNEKKEFILNHLDQMDEGFLSVFYETLLSQLNKKSDSMELTESQKKEIDRRWERYVNGESKSYTLEEVKQSIGKR